MILRVPTNKASLSGMRSLSNENILKDAFTTLKGRARIKRTMWSRRAQPEQSYSERQLYERALDRMVREVAAINKTDRDAAIEIVMETLNTARAKAAAKAAKEEEKKAASEDGKEAAA